MFKSCDNAKSGDSANQEIRFANLIYRFAMMACLYAYSAGKLHVYLRFQSGCSMQSIHYNPGVGEEWDDKRDLSE